MNDKFEPLLIFGIISVVIFVLRYKITEKISLTSFTFLFCEKSNVSCTGLIWNNQFDRILCKNLEKVHCQERKEITSSFLVFNCRIDKGM